MLVLGVKKNSATAQHIHSLVHGLFQAVEAGDQQTVNRHVLRLIGIENALKYHRRSPYNMLWFVQIAQQYPAALAARPDLAKFVDEIMVSRKAMIRGRRDYTVGYLRYDNPYCGYTQELAYESWHEGWDDACRNDDEDDDEFDE